MLAVVCMFGGPIVNRLGTKWALVIGAMSFPIQGAAYYCNSKYGTQWVRRAGHNSLISLLMVVPDLWIVYQRRRNGMLVCCGIGNDHVACP